MNSYKVRAQLTTVLLALCLVGTVKVNAESLGDDDINNSSELSKVISVDTLVELRINKWAVAVIDNDRKTIENSLTKPLYRGALYQAVFNNKYMPVSSIHLTSAKYRVMKKGVKISPIIVRKLGGSAPTSVSVVVTDNGQGQWKISEISATELPTNFGNSDNLSGKLVEIKCLLCGGIR